MKRRTAIAAALALAALVGVWIGYFLGTQKTIYHGARGAIVTSLSSNAKIDSQNYDRLQNDNDVMIVANYRGIQRIPAWMVSIFTQGEDQASTKAVKQYTDGIKKSLSRLGQREPRDKIEHVVRRLIAWQYSIERRTEQAAGVQAPSRTDSKAE